MLDIWVEFFDDFLFRAALAFGVFRGVDFCGGDFKQLASSRLVIPSTRRDQNSNGNAISMSS